MNKKMTIKYVSEPDYKLVAKILDGIHPALEVLADS